MPDVKRTFSYWHLGVDSAGVSHLERRTVSGFERAEVAEGAPSIWSRDLETVPEGVRIGILPVGQVAQWHENAQPQWIVPLSGTWFVEAMDGTRVEMGPGEMSFGADQGTVEQEDGKRGHRSGAVGNQPAVVMVLPVQATGGSLSDS